MYSIIWEAAIALAMVSMLMPTWVWVWASLSLLSSAARLVARWSAAEEVVVVVRSRA